MIKIVMHGCCGRMGRIITDLAAEDTRFTIVAGVDTRPADDLGYPVYATLAEVVEEYEQPSGYGNVGFDDEECVCLGGQ